MKTHYSIKDVQIYDNSGMTADRFTVAFPWDKRREFYGQKREVFAMIGMGETPFHPQGFCQHCEGTIGPHLGKRISYVDLNDDCAKVIRRELAAYNADAAQANQFSVGHEKEAVFPRETE